MCPCNSNNDHYCATKKNFKMVELETLKAACVQPHYVIKETVGLKREATKPMACQVSIS